MKHEIDQRMHERLCAYLFGELRGEEREAFERELAASPELREEKERLEKTLALVKSTNPPAEALPAAARETLAARAASPGAVRPFYRRPAFALAAGIAAVAATAALWRVIAKQEVPSAANNNRDLLAKADSPDRGDSTGGDDLFAKSAPRDASARAGLRLTDESQVEGRGKQLDKEELPAGAPLPEEKAKELRERLAQAAGKPVAGTSAASSTTPAPSDSPLSLLALHVQPAGQQVDLDAVRKLGLVAAGQPGAGGPSSTTAADPNSIFVGRLGSQAEVGAGVLGGVGADAAVAPTLSTPGWTLPTETEGKVEYGFEALLMYSDPAEGEVSQLLEALGYAGAAPEPVAKSKSPTGPESPSPGSPGGSVGPAAGFRVPHAPGAGGESGYDTTASGNVNKRRSLSESEIAAIVGHSGDFFTRGRVQPSFDPDQILHWCRRFPNETPRDMFFRFWGDNPFEYALQDHLSTFSIDVDTASYTLVRKYLAEGHLPPKAAVRTEEFVNYFKPDLAAPSEGVFALGLELAPSRFGRHDASFPSGIAPERWMLRATVRGREVAKQERAPLRLTYVIDVSGSMKEGNRLELVKHSLRLLAGELFASDSIAIVAFSNEARLILPPTSAVQRALIESALFGLIPDGGTNSEAGLRLGYAQAEAMLDREAHNRVVFLSDGVANIGVTDPAVICEGVKAVREKGIFLNSIGVGMNNHNDAFLEQLADKGNGVCNYIDSAAEAKKALVDNFTGAFQTIARDVKIQVDFDPAQVLRYRLLGYENRAVADADFRNDKIDAGEVGAGVQVTALYELELAGALNQEAPLATLHVRYAALNSNSPGSSVSEASEIQRSISMQQAAGAFEGTTPGYRRAVIAAQFAEILRRSVHARGDSLDELMAAAQKLEPELKDADFTELATLMARSRDLILRSQPRESELGQAIEALRRNSCLKAELEDLQHAADADLLAKLDEQNRKLEEQVRELLKRRLEELEKAKTR